MRHKTIICITCNSRNPYKGRVCDKCLYLKRKEYYSKYNANKKRKPPRYYKYRYKAVAHYGNKCKKCGYDEVPEILEVNHIDLNRKNNKLANLEVLCPNCHSAFHFYTRTGSFKELGKSKHEMNYGTDNTEPSPKGKV